MGRRKESSFGTESFLLARRSFWLASGMREPRLIRNGGLNHSEYVRMRCTSGIKSLQTNAGQDIRVSRVCNRGINLGVWWVVGLGRDSVASTSRLKSTHIPLIWVPGYITLVFFEFLDPEPPSSTISRLVDP